MRSSPDARLSGQPAGRVVMVVKVVPSLSATFAVNRLRLINLDRWRRTRLCAARPDGLPAMRTSPNAGASLAPGDEAITLMVRAVRHLYCDAERSEKWILHLRRLKPLTSIEVTHAARGWTPDTRRRLRRSSRHSAPWRRGRTAAAVVPHLIPTMHRAVLVGGSESAVAGRRPDPFLRSFLKSA